MLPEDDDKKWGRIYMGGPREASLEQLDAMQAATRREQWNQRTQGEYLERVRERATERAREILGEAYQERQKILDEAREEAGRILEDVQRQRRNVDNTLAQAEKIQTEAEAVRAEADRLHAQAKSDGYDAGLVQAGEELDAFRAAMGESVAAVLAALQQQCDRIFEGWREEVVELFRVCVEKGTGWVLDEQYAAVLESLVVEAVRQLEDRRVVTLRVHPDDEATVADMFVAARERLPGLGQWIVTGDASVALGGLIAEGKSGTVDNRLELHRELVENALRQLTLPPGAAEQGGAQAVQEVVRTESEHIARLAPPVPYPDADESQDVADVAADGPTVSEASPEAGEPAAQGMPSDDGLLDSTEVKPASGQEEQFFGDAAQILSPTPEHQDAVAMEPPAVDDMLDQLEQELLPIPSAGTEVQAPPVPENPPHVDAALAEGGFLATSDEEVGRS